MKNKKLSRKLSSASVARALKTQQVKHELAMTIVLERVKIDKEFAKDVLRIGGETLREDVKNAAEETLNNGIYIPPTDEQLERNKKFPSRHN